MVNADTKNLAKTTAVMLPFGRSGLATGRDLLLMTTTWINDRFDRPVPQRTMLGISGLRMHGDVK